MARSGPDLAAALSGHVTDARVLDAIARVPRDAFVPRELRDRAWDNEPLPIGEGQTISQPLVVAHMCELLRISPRDRILDVGTGSGYHAAVLAALGSHVWTVEVRERLADRARQALARAGAGNVTCLVGDGRTAAVEHAPFDAVNVAAAADEDALAPLLEQLAPGGRLVAPVGDAEQRLVSYEREQAGRLTRTDHGRVRFVPMLRR